MDYRVTDSAQLGQLIESFRKQHRLTQAELGQKLGISQQSYARMVGKPSSINAENLLKILQVLGVELLLQEPQTNVPSQPEAQSSLAAKILTQKHSSTAKTDNTATASITSKRAW